ncbi:MAG: rhomboid family intramembrane serine protease [Bacteroidota bacterium]
MDIIQYYLQTPVATGIFIITILTSIMAFRDGVLMYKFIFNPYRLVHHKEYQMLFSSALIHGSNMHLILNMLVFYFFAFSLESILGSWQFFVLYWGSVILSHIPRLISEKDNEMYSALGASGGVSAVVMSMILIQPDITLSLYFLIDMPGWLLGLGYMGYSFYAALFKPHDKIGHDAHLWGGLAGLVLTVLLRPKTAADFFEWLNL